MSSQESKKVMLINVTHAEESRVVILSDGILEAFEIETVDQKSRKGDIYVGKVENVQPSLQAAFVDIGDARSAFLPLDELNFGVYPPRRDGGRGRIENHLHRGQKVLVQIVRDAFANKPPTVSTYYSLPGRYLVFTPHNRSSGISRKISDKDRERIKKLLTDLAPPEPHGVIARTAGASATKLEMQRDIKYLVRLWEKIEQAAEAAAPPSLVYQERSMVLRAMRDLYTTDIDEILVDDEETYQEIVDFFEIFDPRRKKVVKLYQGHRPIFNKHNLEEQIENIFRRRVPLPSGGAIIIDTTEALTAIDVNSAKMKKEGHIEETATKANVEAAREIGRQLRLRDAGGLIVIDFIDMRQAKNCRLVEKTMRESLKGDKARWDMTRLSRLGLLEISRERVGAQKASHRYRDCPTCEGTGSIKTIEAAAVQAIRRAQTRVVRGKLKEVVLTVPVDVAEYLLNNKRSELIGWETRYGIKFTVHGDAELGRDDLEINEIEKERGEESENAALVEAPTEQEILASIEEEGELTEEDEDQSASESENGDGAGKKKRRRRRRRGRGSASRGDGEGSESELEDPQLESGESGDEADDEAAASDSENGDGTGKKKRRRRRRGRGSASRGDGEGSESEFEDPQLESGESEMPGESGGEADDEAAASDSENGDGTGKKKRRRRRRRRGGRGRGTGSDGNEESWDSGEEGGEDADVAAEPAAAAATSAEESVPVAAGEGLSGEDRPRLHWWKRLVGG